MAEPTHVCCACVHRLLLAIENGGVDGVIRGALVGVARDHPALQGLERLAMSISKRCRGAVRARLREILGVPAKERFDPWKKHCSTCACEEDAVRRVNGRFHREDARA